MTRYRLEPQFHCSHLDSRGVPEKPRGKKRGKLSPFHFRFTTSGDVISGDATSGDATSGDVTIPIDPPQMRGGWCFYTTDGASGTGTAYPIGAHEFAPGFSGVVLLTLLSHYEFRVLMSPMIVFYPVSFEGGSCFFFMSFVFIHLYWFQIQNSYERMLVSYNQAHWEGVSTGAAHRGP